MQHLIREAMRAKNSTQHALEAACQPLSDTTLMRKAGRIEPQLYALVSELSCNVDDLPLFNTFPEVFLRSNVSAIFDQIMADVLLCDTKRSKPITQELVSLDATISTWTARVVRQVKSNPHPFLISTADSNMSGPN